MKSGNRKLTQKIIAVVVIVALLDLVGIPPTIIIFFVGIGFLIWRAAQRAESQETERIFDFYISADEMLRDKERHWYGFEVTEVINEGERVLTSMPDPPPLVYFALGSLYHLVADYQAAVEHLVRVVEDQSFAEQHRSQPSPQLRRYVETMRKIEREPSIAPQAMAATRSLERLRRKCATELLAESRGQLGVATSPQQVVSYAFPHHLGDNGENISPLTAEQFSSINAPPPICDVLHDVYEEEKSA